MKTRFAKKETSKNFEVLSQNEMKQIEGGLRYIVVREPDGSIHYILVLN